MAPLPKLIPGAASDADSDTDVVGGANADDDTKTPAIDPERDEAINILADLVDLSRGPKTASANNVDKTAPEQRPVTHSPSLLVPQATPRLPLQLIYTAIGALIDGCGS